MLDARYVAGLFDGEGSLGLYRHHRGRFTLRTQLVQNIYPASKLLFDELIAKFGGNASPQRSLSGKRKFNWQLHAHKAAAFLRWIYPYLRFKREEAMIALDWQMIKPEPTRDKHTGWFKPYPASAEDKRAAAQLKRLKRKR